MTALKIITSNNAYFLWLINTFTVSIAFTVVGNEVLIVGNVGMEFPQLLATVCA
jgi:hypothetical protein